MKKALITGITGFAGSHLAELLVAENTYEIYGTYNTSKTHKNLESVQEKITLHQADLTNFESVLQLMGDIKPDVLFHLAAFPSPAKSFTDPASFLTNNISAELNVLEALKQTGLTATKVLVVSSSEIYGKVNQDELPMKESTPLRPVSPYGVSKIAQDYMGLQYFMAYGMPVIRVRPFGHIGPRLSTEFVVSAFSKKIVEIEKGIREPILTVGNLESKRDLTDVRDMVKAYSLLIEKGDAGDVYNAGRGESYQIKDLLNMLLSLSSVNVEIKEDPALLRPMDIPELLCDNTKIEQKTGWKAQIALEKSLKDTLDYWRETL